MTKKYNVRFCVWHETEKRKYFSTEDEAWKNAKSDNRVFLCYQTESRYTCDGLKNCSKELFKN